MTDAELAIDGRGVRARLRVDRDDVERVETLSRHGDSYIWTGKQGGVRIGGLVELDGRPIQFDAGGVVDDSAGYHARHTVWSWSAGVGALTDGRPVAWNLVAGVHDAPEASERTIWIEGRPAEAGPVTFASNLTGISGSGVALSFTAWSTREDRTNALLVKSHYEQPFGTFKGKLADDLTLAEGYGVMESHDVWW
jgi:hypothetical protein